jgi:subtilisin-like proprotein convertase family protein
LESRVLLCAVPKGGVLDSGTDCGCGDATPAVIYQPQTFSIAPEESLNFTPAAADSPAPEDPGTKVPTISVGSVVNISRATGNQTEADITINPTNPNQIFAVSNIATGNSLFASRSNDGGVNWTTASIATGSDGLTAACCDARVTYDKFGNLWMVYLNSSANAVIIARSTNNGANWTQLLSRSGNWDNPAIASGIDGQVWVEVRSSSGVAGIGWKATGLGAIDTTIGTAGFTATQNVPGTTTSQNYGDIAVLNDGSVLIGWTNSSGQGPVTNGVARDPDGVGPSTFGAAIFSYSTNVGGFDFIPAQNNRSVDSEPNFAVAPPGTPFAGRVYLTYLDETVNENNDTDVIVRYSDNAGTTWSGPIRVNDDPASPIRSQFLQQIAVDPTTGGIVASWHDSRNDNGVLPNGTNGVANDDAQFWGALSVDGGVTWQNFLIDPGWSNAVKANNGIDFGDWTGSDYYGGKFFAVWASNASNLANNPSTTQFDLATAAVSITGISSNQSIAGAVFDDANGNGVRDGGDAGINGVTVFIDADSSGGLSAGDPTTTTNIGGLYSFDSLANGTYIVRTVAPAGRRLTLPAGGSYTVNFSGTTVTNRDFGYVNPRVAGTVFNDANDNGIFDATETGLSGVTVFIDADSSGGLSAGDPTTTTDAGGNYVFGGLANGTYTVRVVTPAGRRLTFPAAGFYTHTVTNAAVVFTGDNFGQTDRARVSGFVYSDNNGNGVKDAGEAGLSGVRVFQDLNGNGSWDNTGGTLNSSDVPKTIADVSSVQSVLNVSGVGNVSTVTVTLNITHTFDADLVLKLISPSGTIVTLATNRGGSGDNFTDTTFSDAAATAISAGTAPFSGSFKPESVLSALIGENGNGTWKLQVDDTASGDTGTINSWSLTLGTTEPNVLTAGDGGYSFTALGAGNYNLRQTAVTNYVFTAPSSGGQNVSLAAAQVAAANFGDFPIAYNGSQMVLRLDPAGNSVQVWVDQSTVNPPTYTAAKTLLASKTLAFTGTGGNDSLTVDAVNGNPLPASGGASFNGLGNTAAGDTLVILGKSTAAETVVFNSGSASINALPISQTGVENEQFDGKGGGDALTVNGGPTVNIAGPQTLTSATLAAGANAAVAPGGANLLVTNTVSVGAGGRLDVADNDMLVRGMTAPAVKALLAATYNAGNWNGTGGIGSSAASNDPNKFTALGYGSNADLNKTSFDGVTGLTSSDVLVKYTYYGDANLDGQVDIGDLGLLAGAWQQSGTDWFHGDFTYNGTVDIGDLGLLSGNWQKGVGNPL